MRTKETFPALYAGNGSRGTPVLILKWHEINRCMGKMF
jgi:hypothetical protein